VIEVLNAGIGSSFQDLGRPGLAHLGVGRSGAADRPSHRLANRLLGNDESAATIETCGGLALRLHTAATVVVTGARGAIDVRGGRAMAVNNIDDLPAGAEFTVRAPDENLQYYVAVRGGFDVEPVLGSRSFDTLAALGPRLHGGERIAIGPDPRTPMTTEWGFHQQLSTEIRVSDGPRFDWFTAEAWTLLTTQPYIVSPSGNRVGARLTGPALERVAIRELLSEGLVEGAMQVPPDGQPIVMLADHPVTGGYPVIAVVAPEDIASVAQARPGTVLRFRRGGG